MMRFYWMNLLLRETPDPGGGGNPSPAPAPAPALDPNPAPSPAPAPAPSPAPAAAYRPEGLPDHLVGGSDKETVDKLFGAYKGARDHIAKWGDVPKDAGGYTFEWSDPVKPYMGDADLPLLEEVKKIGHAHGLAGKQLSGFVNGILQHMVEAELVAPAFSADKERALIAPDVTDPKEREKAADARIRENIDLVKTWKEQQGGLPEEAAAFLDGNMDRAGAFKLIRWIADLRGDEIKPALGGNPAGGTGGLTRAQIDARWSDPRQHTDNPKYDAEFAKETDRLYKALAEQQS